MLSDSLIKDSLKQCNDIEEQVIEKTRALFHDNQQKSALHLSMEYLEGEMNSCLDDAQFALQMKGVADRECIKLSKKIQSLKTALRSIHGYSFHEDELLHEQENDENEPTEVCSQSKEQLRELLHELVLSRITHSSDGELAQIRLNVLVQQMVTLHDKISMEYNLLMSKCHQIHQLESTLNNLHTNTLTHELTMEHYLQNQVARKTKSEIKIQQVSYHSLGKDIFILCCYVACT